VAQRPVNDSPVTVDLITTHDQQAGVGHAPPPWKFSTSCRTPFFSQIVPTNTTVPGTSGRAPGSMVATSTGSG
jgi:hypothetical protein